MDALSPPPYRHSVSQPAPTYSPTSPTSPNLQESGSTTHEFQLLNNKDKPWATLTIRSSATSPKHLPKFFEGKELAGSVVLNLDSGDHIQAITIAVKGRVITGASATDSYTFLNHAQTLWSRAMGDPRSTASATDGKYSRKLIGDYTWPFSFPFPSEVSMSGAPGVPAQVLRLPHTFLERSTSANIQYDLVVRISRGKLRMDSKIQTQVAYIPNIIPKPPSMLRQHAYIENVPVPGPEIDPEGWCTLQPAIIRGQVFNVRPTEVKCTLSLANPLCYTRGTVIPCSLIIQGLDPQALDLLASPKTIVVRLRRRVKYFLFAAQALSKRQSIASKTASEDMETAVWRIPSEINSVEECQRRLDGEIHLSKDLQPSSTFAPFIIEYFVDLLPFESAGFIPAVTEPLLSQSVEIATVYAAGPRPRAYTENSAKKVEVEYVHRGAGGNRAEGFVSTPFAF